MPCYCFVTNIKWIPIDQSAFTSSYFTRTLTSVRWDLGSKIYTPDLESETEVFSLEARPNYIPSLLNFHFPSWINWCHSLLEPSIHRALLRSYFNPWKCLKKHLKDVYKGKHEHIFIWSKVNCFFVPIYQGYDKT